MDTPDTFSGLFWGYTIIWLLIVAYVVMLGRRMSKLEKSAPQKDA